MNDWKNKVCGTCIFQVEAPNSGGVLDLKAPKVLLCRKQPPQLIFAIGQQRSAVGHTSPVPIPLGSSYALVDLNYPACSFHQEEESSMMDYPVMKI